jgi:catechol 2,3-dioxygenase-like lactoylglutathione lyase family enzyme
MAVERLGFLGVRVGDAGRYQATVSLYRDVLGLVPEREEAGRLTWFRLADGTPIHVYGPADDDHVAFGEAPFVGLTVDDVDGAARRLASAGIEMLDPEIERGGGAAWIHYRGPDGGVYELIGPDRSESTP